MFVLSLKPNRKKGLLAICVVLVVAVAVLVMLSVSHDQGYLVMANQKYSLKAGTNDERIGFLQQFGWNVNAEPVEITEITIPQTFNDVYENYNKLQKTQGMDLAHYSGKICKQWIYQVTNYKDNSVEVRATLLIIDGKVIGGDISSTALNGFMCGFFGPENSMENIASQNTASSKASESAKPSSGTVSEPVTAQPESTETAVQPEPAQATEKNEIPANAWPTD